MSPCPLNRGARGTKNRAEIIYSPENYYNKILKLLEIMNPKLSVWAKKQINQELFE